MVAEPALVMMTTLLGVVLPQVVVVDVADVTFAGATLINFFVRVHDAIPDGASLVVCRPTPMLRFVFDIMDLQAIAILREDLPVEETAECRRRSIASPLACPTASTVLVNRPCRIDDPLM